MTGPIIDIHTHLAGVGHGGTGCWMSRKKFNSLVYRLLRFKLGLNHVADAADVDKTYLSRMEQDLTAATAHGALDGAVIFPHERMYDDAGKPIEALQDMYVPNEYAIACAERAMVSGQGGTPRWRFLPAMSVHPYRPDALEATRKFLAAGAVAMKWLPSSQNIDARDKRCGPIFDLLARAKVPLIAHTGGEHTVRVTRKDLGDPDALIPALEAGVTVVMAHCGTRSLFFETDWSGRFAALARKYPNCYGDTSAFSAPGRTRWANWFIRHGDLLPKLVHGSDYPVPPSAWLSVMTLGFRQARRIGGIWSLMERDVAIKRAKGFPDFVFANAARILPPASLQRWGVSWLTG